MNDFCVVDALLVSGQVLLPGEERGADVALEVLDLEVDSLPVALQGLAPGELEVALVAVEVLQLQVDGAGVVLQALEITKNRGHDKMELQGIEPRRFF